MAARGAKPKPAHLRLINGTHREDRHGSAAAAKQAVEKARESFGDLEKPKWMKGEAAKAWKEFIEPCYWLDGSAAPTAIVFCELWAEFRRAPNAFSASRHTAMRLARNDLGLMDDRARGGAPGEEDKDEFFD